MTPRHAGWTLQERLSRWRALVAMLEAGASPRQAWQAALEVGGGGAGGRTRRGAGGRVWPGQGDPVTEALVADGPPGWVAARLEVARLEARERAGDGVGAIAGRLGAVLAVAAIGFTALVTVVMPRMGRIFDSMNVELPWFTSLLVRAGRVFDDLGVEAVRAGDGLGVLVFVVCLAGLACTGIACAWSGFAWARFPLERGAMRVPLLGRVLRGWRYARQARDLGSLLAAGVAPERALAALARQARSEGDGARERAFDAARFHVILRGQNVSDALWHAGCDARVVQLVRCGEETGGAAELLLADAAHAEKRVGERLSGLARAALPVALLGLVFGCGVVVCALFSPMQCLICVCS